ncbi:hypothetical protein Afil01_64200 [Actinorhabdospora filicis]|uniref:DUF1349 domain-containing protein n=1 Tax=Actinorhabdospora filicis TaxID=1785913 RepID=A0A9W6ST66_9ACTN|nr:hypothetical protein [Actinorhabdospora filicis]GLZ81613.1 hypothetical protein Afil01_64200 [Actinorhabdospora filicis]
MPNAFATQWTDYRRRIGNWIGLACAFLLLAGFGVLVGAGDGNACMQGDLEVACVSGPVGPDGNPVADIFAMAGRDLGPDGMITARLTAMNGIITYPPPNHDEIVSGLVPWAKTGLIIKDGTGQGSSYAAIAMTGAHGVRFQYDYTGDIAGSPAGELTRWLRLVRAGDEITGYESPDGLQWTEVGRARLRLPERVRVGLFTASPGDVTVEAIGAAMRFTQATGRFENVTVEGAPQQEWSADHVGEYGHTDWEKDHKASGVVRDGEAFEVTGSGDIGPVSTDMVRTLSDTLAGLPFALLALLIAAARFGARGAGRPGTAARAGVAGAAAFAVTTVGAAVAVWAGSALRAPETPMFHAGFATGARVVLGAGVFGACAAVLALALGVLLRKGWRAGLVASAAALVPYLFVMLPVLPPGVVDWLFMVTPSAGYSVLGVLTAYPQVESLYAPYTGYYPLPWWAGLLIAAAYAGALLYPAVRKGRADRPAWR